MHHDICSLNKKHIDFINPKPCTDIQIAWDGLQQRFQHAEYFTCDTFISQPIPIRFSLLQPLPEGNLVFHLQPTVNVTIFLQNIKYHE